MRYYRVQPYPARDLLREGFATTYWSADADDVITVPGVAVCPSLEVLAAYLVASGASWDEEWHVVQVEGTPTGLVAEDADQGVLYIHPTRIVDTEPATARLLAMTQQGA